MWVSRINQLISLEFWYFIGVYQGLAEQSTAVLMFVMTVEIRNLQLLKGFILNGRFSLLVFVS